MLHLRHLSLVNFKNISGAELHLGAKFNCMVGNNGSGKTTILDAVHYLSVCKSFLNAIDTQNIRHDDPFFMLTGTFERNEETELVSCSMKREGKKQFRRNRKEYQRLADHVGLFPSVVISPADTDLISGGSEQRRKFLDGVIAQFDKDYLEHLMVYNKVLLQRNALLKSFAEGVPFNASLLEVYNMQLAQRGQRIYELRVEFLGSLLLVFQKFYAQLSGGVEQVGISYESQLESDILSNLLTQALPRDRAATHTTVGVHKDDLVFTIGGHPLKRFGSQGQQKSVLVALKLAQYDIMRQKTGLLPLLLLDDIFDKLDDGRVAQLLDLVNGPDFGQILITDTHPERTAKLLKGETGVHVFHVSNGIVERK